MEMFERPAGHVGPDLDGETPMAVDVVALRRECAAPWWFPGRTVRGLLARVRRLNVPFTYRALERAQAVGPRAAAAA